MSIIEKEISGAKVEIGLEERAFNTFEAFTEEVGKVGPYSLHRHLVGPTHFTLRGENGVEMRIDVKDVIMKCVQEFHTLVEAKAAE